MALAGCEDTTSSLLAMRDHLVALVICFSRIRCALGFLGDISLFLNLCWFFERRSTSSTLGRCTRLDAYGLLLTFNMLRVRIRLRTHYWLLVLGLLCASVCWRLVTRWQILFPPIRVWCDRRIACFRLIDLSAVLFSTLPSFFTNDSALPFARGHSPVFAEVAQALRRDELLYRVEVVLFVLSPHPLPGDSIFCEPPSRFRDRAYVSHEPWAPQNRTQKTAKWLDWSTGSLHSFRSLSTERERAPGL